MTDGEGERLGDRLTAAVPLITLGVGLTALFFGYDWFWIVFVIGFAVLTPLVAVLFGSHDEEEWIDWSDGTTEAGEPSASRTEAGEDRSKQDALDTLRDRYARGELTEEEFERKLEALLSTETLEDARRHAERSGDATDGETDEDAIGGEVEPEREREY